MLTKKDCIRGKIVRPSVDLKRKVEKFVFDNDIIKRGDGIVVGLSGGADSVCLLKWLSSVREELDLYICCVHVHHGIRGDEADCDMDFVKEICAAFEVPLEIRKYDVPAYARENGISCEEAGRKLRYEAFEEVRKEKGLDKIAVAHHKDDSAETILFNMARGTGAKGVIGIAPVYGVIVRPLLCLTREEIEEYLLENNMSWRIDSTNLSDGYSRNKIRHLIIPTLKEINKHAVGHILESGAVIGDMYRYICSEAKEKFYGISEVMEGEVIINADSLIKEDKVIRREIIRLAIETVCDSLKDVTAKHICSAEALLFGQSGHFCMLPYGIRVIKEQTCLRVYNENRRQETALEKEVCIEINLCVKGEYELPFGNGTLIAEPLGENKNIFDENTLKNMYTKRMDCDKIRGTLLLRTRKSGDYFTVNGGQSRKKLKEYFIEQKVPVSQRDKVPLLADGSHILWVMGYRMSDGCKITQTTKKQIEFTWIK